MGRAGPCLRHQDGRSGDRRGEARRLCALWRHRRRDAALSDSAQTGLDRAFLVLLFLTAVSGLLLLALRDRPVMGVLLVAHLGIVLALFVTLPYGKLVHGVYRAAALLKYRAHAALSHTRGYEP